MILQSKYKCNSEIAIKSSKIAYKLKRAKKDKFAFWATPVALLIMIGVMIYDIVKSNSLVLDIILVAALLLVQILNLVMPIIASKMQAKYFKKLDELNYDYFISEFNDGVFKEKVYKDSQLIMCNQVSIEKMQNYAMFDNFLVVVFDNYAMLLFDLDNMQMGTKEDLIKLMETTMGLKKKKKSKK